METPHRTPRAVTRFIGRRRARKMPQAAAGSRKQGGDAGRIDWFQGRSLSAIPWSVPMNPPAALALSLALGLTAAGLAEPGSPSLVRSIDLRAIPAGQGPNNGTNMGTYPGGFARVGDRVVFGAAVPEGYRELFVMSAPNQASLQEINLDPRAGLDSWPNQSVSAGDLAYVRVSRWERSATPGDAQALMSLLFAPSAGEWPAVTTVEYRPDVAEALVAEAAELWAQVKAIREENET